MPLLDGNPRLKLWAWSLDIPKSRIEAKSRRRHHAAADPTMLWYVGAFPVVNFTGLSASCLRSSFSRSRPQGAGTSPRLPAHDPEKGRSLGDGHGLRIPRAQARPRGGRSREPGGRLKNETRTIGPGDD